MTDQPDLRVILVGIDYFAQRGSSDKNFWFEIMPDLRHHAAIEIVSFNYRPVAVEVQTVGEGDIRVHNVKPAHLGIDLRPDLSSVHNPYKCHAHFKRQPRSLLEYSLSMLKIAPKLNRLSAGYSAPVVHFMDNFGPTMRLVRTLPSRPRLAVSAMGYYARGRFHDHYLRLSFAGLDAIVPYSQAYAEKLSAIGLDASIIQPILWGVHPETGVPRLAPTARAGLRRRLGLPQDQRVVVWTGPIQQLGEPELYMAHKVARQVLETRQDVMFVFLLKPEGYREEYVGLAREGIRLLSTSQDEFRDYVQVADLLLAPVTNLASIVTPPLTWLEFMARGIPIVTNRAPGVDAVIEDGVSGFVAADHAALGQTLLGALRSDLPAVGLAAQRHVREKYNAAGAAQAYLNLWQALANAPGG